MRHGRGPFGLSHLDLVLGDQGPGNTGAQQVTILVYRTGLEHGPDIVFHEFLAQVLDNTLVRAAGQGLLLDSGIESIIKADDCGGMLMGVSLIRKGGIKLMVTDGDMEKAEEALAVLDDDSE